MADFNKYALDENLYKADDTLLEKYIAFSSELLRISLLVLGGYGALITIVLKDPQQAPRLQNAKSLLLSMILFAICSGATLAHRFYATDSLAWQVAFYRASAADNHDKAAEEKKGWIKCLRRAKSWLITSEWVFGAAVTFFIYGLLQYLFQ